MDYSTDAVESGFNGGDIRRGYVADAERVRSLRLWSGSGTVLESAGLLLGIDVAH